VKNEDAVTASEVKQREGGADCKTEESEEREIEGATELCRERNWRSQRKRKLEWARQHRGGREAAGNVYKREGTPLWFPSR